MTKTALNELTLPANILLAGASGSGKSYWTRHTLLPIIKGQYDILVICSPTLDVNGDYDFIEEKPNKIFKVQHNIPQAIAELIDSQADLFKQFNSKIIKRDQIPRICVILDDCLSSNVFDDRGILSKFAIKSRHYQMSFICMTQRIAGISRQFRINCSYFTGFSVMCYSELERIVMEYVPKKFQKGFQDKLIDLYDTKYNFIFINNREQQISNRLFKNGTELIQFD